LIISKPARGLWPRSGRRDNLHTTRKPFEEITRKNRIGTGGNAIVDGHFHKLGSRIHPVSPGTEMGARLGKRWRNRSHRKGRMVPSSWNVFGTKTLAGSNGRRDTPLATANCRGSVARHGRRRPAAKGAPWACQRRFVAGVPNGGDLRESMTTASSRSRSGRPGGWKTEHFVGGGHEQT